MNGLDFLAQSNIRFDLKRQNAFKLFDNLRQSRRNSALSFLLFVSGLTTVPASSTFIFNEKVLSSFPSTTETKFWRRYRTICNMRTASRMM